MGYISPITVADIASVLVLTNWLFFGITLHMRLCSGTMLTQVADPDTRISADVSESVNGFAKCFSDTLYTTTAGVLYTFEIWRYGGPESPA